MHLMTEEVEQPWKEIWLSLIREYSMGVGERNLMKKL